MKRISTWIAAPVIAAAAAQPTLAAEFSAPYAIRGGGSLSSDESSRFGVLLGLSRNLGAAGRIDVDFARQAKSGNRSQTAGVSYVHRLDFGKFYAGLGVGVYHVSVKHARSGIGIDDDRFTLGGKVLVGVNITPRVFVETAYTKVGKVSGVDASNLAVMLGIRF